MVPSEAALAVFLMPPLALMGCVLVLCTGLAAIVWLVAFRAVTPRVARTPQGAFHVSLTALFALILSFTASDAWRRSDTAYAALLREAGEAAALVQLAEVSPGRAALRDGLRDYLAASLRDEWGRANTVGSDAAGTALDRLRVMLLTELSGPGTAVARLALDRVDAIAQARGIRLVAGGLYGDALRWAVLVSLFTLGLAGIAIVHWDRPGSAPVAMALYAAAGSVALGMVAASEHPYAGWDATTPDRLRAIVAALGG